MYVWLPIAPDGIFFNQVARIVATRYVCAAPLTVRSRPLPYHQLYIRVQLRTAAAAVACSSGEKRCSEHDTIIRISPNKAAAATLHTWIVSPPGSTVISTLATFMSPRHSRTTHVAADRHISAFMFYNVFCNLSRG